jgi:hypothetical protein
VTSPFRLTAERRPGTRKPAGSATVAEAAFSETPDTPGADEGAPADVRPIDPEPHPVVDEVETEPEPMPEPAAASAAWHSPPSAPAAASPTSAARRDPSAPPSARRTATEPAQPRAAARATPAHAPAPAPRPAERSWLPEPPEPPATKEPVVDHRPARTRPAPRSHAEAVPAPAPVAAVAVEAAPQPEPRATPAQDAPAVEPARTRGPTKGRGYQRHGVGRRPTTLTLSAEAATALDDLCNYYGMSKASVTSRALVQLRDAVLTPPPAAPAPAEPPSEPTASADTLAAALALILAALEQRKR